MNTDTTPALNLPLDLADGIGPPIAELMRQPTIVLSVPDDYETATASSDMPGEIYIIQRLLTISRAHKNIHIQWGSKIAEKVKAAAALYPLLAILLNLQQVTHQLLGATKSDGDEFVASARKTLSQHRLMSDFFSSSQILLCADSRGQGRPFDLYDPSTGKLRRREDFETLVIDVLARQLDTSVELTNAFRNATALGVVVAELFENTELHGRFDIDGKPIQPNAMRGISFKRVNLKTLSVKGAVKDIPPPTIECLEISVFDTGAGYFESFTKQKLDSTTSLNLEWKVLHNCLERHYFPDIDHKQPSHRSMGLAEVLRALQSLSGRIELRTGRLFAYRTFVEGELQAQMEELSSRFAHHAVPKPRMLDVAKKYLAVPSRHEHVVGSSVRVLVPLV